jgi:hypothetical protein
MDKEAGLLLLKNVIEKEIYHQDYERVTELASDYFKMKTGKGLTEKLDRILTRETEEEKKQRDNISKPIIPAILNSTQLPFQKCLRAIPVNSEIKYITGINKKEELELFIASYWGEESLAEYLQYTMIAYNYIDPNAFLITEFEPFDANVEKASPYPFIATSEEAIMFEYKNENLQYLIVRLPIKFKSNDTEQDGFKFTMYLGPDTIQLTQVEKDYQIVEDAIIIQIKENFYLYQEFTPKAKKVPARRFGFLRDDETQGRTFVSVFHNIKLVLEKLMKTDSELDLTAAMIAFAQRFAYVNNCPNQQCYGGKLLDGHTECNTCHGTGQQQPHKGVGEVITFTIPRDLTQMIDLDKMLVYKYPPIELLDWQQSFVDYLMIFAHKMMFNNEIATRSETATNITATEKNFGEDNMNDTLNPFARNYSAMWKFVIKDIATFTDLNEGLSVIHIMPKDFKIKGLLQLCAELKALRDAGAASVITGAVEDDINAILYGDRPKDLKKIEIKNKFNPFYGMSESTVRLLISQGLTTEYNATLWANLESIFNDLELENPNIYEMNNKVIRDAVKVKTQEYIDQMKAEIPEPVQPPFNA